MESQTFCRRRVKQNQDCGLRDLEVQCWQKPLHQEPWTSFLHTGSESPFPGSWFSVSKTGDIFYLRNLTGLDKQRGSFLHYMEHDEQECKIWRHLYFPVRTLVDTRWLIPYLGDILSYPALRCGCPGDSKNSHVAVTFWSVMETHLVHL